MAGQPKAPFYIAVFLVVAGLIAFSAWRMMQNQPGPANQPPHQVANEPEQKPDGGTKPGPTPATGSAEAADTAGITTVKEYTFKPSERLPADTGTAKYGELKDNTVKFALNVWAGWAPIIYANNGFKAGKVWKTADGQDFRVELVLIDNPIEMRDSYAAGI